MRPYSQTTAENSYFQAVFSPNLHLRRGTFHIGCFPLWISFFVMIALHFCSGEKILPPFFIGQFGLITLAIFLRVQKFDIRTPPRLPM